MLGCPLMLQVNLPVVERNHSQSNMCGSKGTDDSKLSDSPGHIVL